MQSSLTTLCPNCGKELTADTQPAACPHCRYLFSVDLKSFIVPEDHGLCVKEIRTGIEKERFEEVGLLIHHLIHRNFLDDKALRMIGMELHATHKDALALACCERAVQINPQDAWNHHALSETCQQIGMLEAAFKHAQEAVRLDPMESRHHARIAEVYDKQNQSTLSARSYLMAMALSGAYIKNFDQLIDDAIDLVMVESTYEELRKQHPEVRIIHFAMGNLYLGKMNYEKAETAFQQVVSSQPSNVSALNRLAEVYQKQNKPEQALEMYKRSLASEESNLDTLRNLGKLYKEKSNWAEALKYFERILKINNKDSNAAYETKEMYRKLNNPQKAIEVMKEYQRTDVSYYNWAMHHIFEILYYDLKDDKQLIELVEKTYPNKITDSFVYDYYGYSLMNTGRLDEAVKAFERFVELEPKNARVMRELGRVFCDLQRYQEAIEVLKKSFAIENKNSYGYYYLALAYHKLGKDDLARKTLNEGKQFDPTYKWFDELLTEMDPNYTPTAIPENVTETPVTTGTGVLGETVAPALPNFLRDLTQLAKEGKIENIFGRTHELMELIEVLCRRNKANPLIVGAPGVGKTVLVNGLAHLLAQKKVPDILQDYRLLELEVFAVVAGTRYVGTLEQKFMQLAQYCRQNKVIIFIDELHTLMGAGSYSSHETGGLDEMFKPLMTQPEFKLIGATTDEEYQKNIAKSGAFDRRFTRITVFEPMRDETMNILGSLRGKIEPFYHVQVSDRMLRTTYDMAEKYIKNRYFPDKACDLLERASIKASLSRSGAEGEIKEVTEEHIVQAVSQVTRIPESNIQIDAMMGMLSLEDRLRMRVIGQEEAIQKVAEVVRMTKSGLDVNPERPDGVFLFVGPTGVGKTELAKALAEALEGSDKRLVRIDMSEYNDQYALSKLIGTAPGFVGYEDEGRLTKAVREDPSAVILLDEIEKAHPKIYEAFLQVFDDGRMTDGKGNVISFSHTTMIMTSNLGAEHIYGKEKLGFSGGTEDVHKQISQGITESMRKHFSPEFLNRIDEIIVFRPLDDEALIQIAQQKLDGIVKRFADRDIRIHIEQDVAALCVRDIDSKREGARGINRQLEDMISRPLSRVMIQNPNCKAYNIKRSENEILVLRGA
ncbi:AAA family ATPase [bacterium]|nr:AAA family ATPase [bacterium]NUN44890.1 AAA family ATPase [bacterium]